MPNLPLGSTPLFIHLERLIVERDRAALWQPLLDEVVTAVQASGGRLERFHPRTILASSGTSCEGVNCDFPLIVAGKVCGSLSVSSSGALSEPAAELGRLAAAVAGLVLENEGRERELDQFVRGATHDLRAALVHGAASAQSLERQLNPDSEQHRLAKLVTEELTHGESLLREMAALAAAGNRRDPPNPVSVKAAAEEARWNLKPALQQRGASLVFEGPDQNVMARERDLVEVFQRLIDNSLKFATNTPIIRIEAEASERGTLISVIDNGPGIDTRFAEAIFEPFRRLHGKRFPGSGLGLTICQKLVAALGGRIWADTATDSGATFRIWLPAAQIVDCQAAS